MATKELGDLRQLYEHAYNSYMSCVDALSEASRNGVWPSQRTLEREEKALNELTYRRQCLLDALFSYSRRESTQQESS